MRKEYKLTIVLVVCAIMGVIWGTVYTLNMPPVPPTNVPIPTASVVSGEVSMAGTNGIIVESEDSGNVTVWYPSVMIGGVEQGANYPLNALLGKPVTAIILPHAKGSPMTGTVFLHSD